MSTINFSFCISLYCKCSRMLLNQFGIYLSGVTCICWHSHYILCFFQDLTNIELFLVSKEIEESLERHETTKCLTWCHENKSKLRKMKVSATKLNFILKQINSHSHLSSLRMNTDFSTRWHTQSGRVRYTNSSCTNAFLRKWPGENHDQRLKTFQPENFSAFDHDFLQVIFSPVLYHLSSWGGRY